MAALTPTAKMQFFKANGTPLVGGKLYTYTAGTTTPQTTFTDSSGGTANANPVILDSRGEANIWLGGSTYKFKLADANDVEIWTVDNISAPTSGVSPALSGNVTIDTNSSSPALKITQTGTGYALRVQDSTDPDATSTVIDNTGKIGIGTISPSELLDVSGGNIALTAAGGTLYAKITPGASLTDIAASGARALTFSTNSTERLRITDTGLVGIGKTPSAGVELDVLGEIVTSTSLTATTSVITDTISERTSAAGVTIDGVLLKDSLIGGQYRPITSDTAQTTTSGNTKSFTGIPTWVNRVTVMLNGVSTAAGSDIYIRIGPVAGVETTGYDSAVSYGGSSVNVTSSTTFSFLVPGAGSGAAYVFNGHAILTRVSGNIWVMSSNIVSTGTNSYYVASSTKTLAGALSVLSVITAGTFDAGSINIFYE
jgi:hypothetical protein